MNSMQTVKPDFDRAIGFTIPGQNARGRMVRLGPVLDEILAAHAYPPVIESLLAEALTVTALVGATLKDANGQLTLQTQSETGVVRLLVCDYRGGEIRGYVQFDADLLAAAPKDPALVDLFGQAYLCLLYTSPSPRDRTRSRMPSSA